MEKILPKDLWIWLSETYLGTIDQIAFCRTCKYLHGILPKKKFGSPDMAELCNRLRIAIHLHHRDVVAASYLNYFIHDFRIGASVFSDPVLWYYIGVSEKNTLEFCNEAKMLEEMCNKAIEPVDTERLRHAMIEILSHCFQITLPRLEKQMSLEFRLLILKIDLHLVEALVKGIRLNWYWNTNILENALKIVLAFFKNREHLDLDEKCWFIMEHQIPFVYDREVQELVKEILIFQPKILEDLIKSGHRIFL